jgi:hypothetical protein
MSTYFLPNDDPREVYDKVKPTLLIIFDDPQQSSLDSIRYAANGLYILMRSFTDVRQLKETDELLDALENLKSVKRNLASADYNRIRIALQMNGPAVLAQLQDRIYKSEGAEEELEQSLQTQKVQQYDKTAAALEIELLSTTITRARDSAQNDQWRHIRRNLTVLIDRLRRGSFTNALETLDAYRPIKDPEEVRSRLVDALDEKYKDDTQKLTDEDVRDIVASLDRIEDVPAIIDEIRKEREFYNSRIRHLQ